VLADGTGHVRTTYVDPLRGCPANRTLGLVVAGDDGKALLREFGKATGPRAFGASGVGGQIAWADPDNGLSFCWLTNGLTPDIVTTFKRSAGLSTRAAQCVRKEVA
jgi:CubicO group peptidase (beta-lactamase class C family)